MSTKILAFAGSTRINSYNKLLVRNAVHIAEQQGATVTLLDLRDYPMPLYDGDLETNSGIPACALELRNLMKENHGILLSCPEYNSAISAVLKNTIDWISRPLPGDPPLVAFSGKTAALLAASPGALGGIRTLASVRSILANLGMIVIPKQYAHGNTKDSFDPDGNLISESAQNRVSAVVEQLMQITLGLQEN